MLTRTFDLTRGLLPAAVAFGGHRNGLEQSTLVFGMSGTKIQILEFWFYKGAAGINTSDVTLFRAELELLPRVGDIKHMTGNRGVERGGVGVRGGNKWKELLTKFAPTSQI